MSKLVEASARFTFKGERPYINISTMFAGLLSVLRDLPGISPSATLTIDMMKAVRELSSHGVFRVAFDVASLPTSEHTVLTVIGSIDGAPLAAALDADHGAGEAPREPGGREKLLVRDLEFRAPFAGRAQLVGINDPADLVLAFVEANKQLHEASASENGKPNIRFGFLSQYSTPLETDLSGIAVPVEIEHVARRSQGDRTHTMNRLTLHVPGGSLRSVLSFNYYR